MEFAEYRLYMPEDKPKTDRLEGSWPGLKYVMCVKELKEEANPKAYILLDSSASIDYHQKWAFSKDLRIKDIKTETRIQLKAEIEGDEYRQAIENKFLLRYKDA